MGPISPSSNWNIWILVAMKYFTKWVKAIPFYKAICKAVANFIKEEIITKFGIPHKIITDNGTPLLNREVRRMLEHYQAKHCRSSPYYP